ncbi:MAG: SUMF1/EgtB/PvdO family nonheme iron enzyme, partial [Candidatus Aenigmarchaeota archaeon]|nr:SUMF1/EgtB/PvdO family nonheme iron enzyme [Candidatus Aenigmarchaeota archaeon]
MKKSVLLALILVLSLTLVSVFSFPYWLNEIFGGGVTGNVVSLSDLSGHWKFEDNFDDGSGNGNTLLNSYVTFTDGKDGLGRAVSFDGVGSVLRVGSSSSFNFGQANDFTIALWLSVQSSGKPQTIVSKGVFNNALRGSYFLQVMATGKPRIILQSSQGQGFNCIVDGEANLNDAGWKHLAVVVHRGATCDGESVEFYVEGVRQSVSVIANRIPTNTGLNNPNPFRVGARVVWDGTKTILQDFFKGEIDELRIYQRALTSNEISELYQGEEPSPGVVGETESANVRIVDFGNDYAWNPTSSGQSLCYGQARTSPALKFQGTSSIVEKGILDVDGDGDSANDFVLYRTFSLTEPFNPKKPGYSEEHLNYKFYGGQTAYLASDFGILGGTGFKECINVDHGDAKDDLNLMFQQREADHFASVHGLWLWKKEDFINRGDEYTVTFDDESTLSVRDRRYYPEGGAKIRFVVQDGQQFYISEQTFEDLSTGPKAALHVLRPTQTEWAVYNPQGPYRIDFDLDNAIFAEHTFTDVQAVGWYIGRDFSNVNWNGLKWGTFEAKAVVTRPIKYSEYFDMAVVLSGVIDGENIPEFVMATKEMDYETWNKIEYYATSNQFTIDEGYVFDSEADMGSMDSGKMSHSTREPVTDVSWKDAIVMANALSEIEGKEPVYYSDSALTKVLRRATDIYKKANYGSSPEIYVKWSADGYRLPTAAEWKLAFALQAIDSTNSWINVNSDRKTQVAGTKLPNVFGLYDMGGNVWEWVWDVPGGVFIPSVSNRHVVLGGDINHPADPNLRSATIYGERPYDGNYNIGFRFVRSFSSIAPPIGNVPSSNSYISSGIPEWSFDEGHRTSPTTSAFPGDELNMVVIPSGSYDRAIQSLGGQIQTVQVTGFDMANTEVTYGQWKKVHDWSIENGYKIWRDGDMGSSDYISSVEMTYSPDEPVTDVSWFDIAT